MVQQLRRRYRESGIRALAEALVIQKHDGSFSESTFKSIPHVGRRTFELFISDGLIELQSTQGTVRRFVVTNKGKSIVGGEVPLAHSPTSSRLLPASS